ncbi:MAG: hypothetical protein ACLRRT_13300, partial [Ruthenibacterium lactatiformans]
INENQKGFLFHNGRFVKLLGAGKYPLFGAREIEIVSLKEPLISAKCELDTLLANSEVAKLTSVCEVADQQLALHYTSGKFDGVLRRGKYAFWSVLERHEYQLVDISTPEVAEDCRSTYSQSFPPRFIQKWRWPSIRKHGCTLTRS